MLPVVICKIASPASLDKMNRVLTASAICTVAVERTTLFLMTSIFFRFPPSHGLRFIKEIALGMGTPGKQLVETAVLKELLTQYAPSQP